MGQHLVGEREGSQRQLQGFSLIGTNVSIAQTVVLSAVILNGNWFVFRPCRSITVTIRLPFQVCVNIAIAPVLKTISNALKFSCLLLFNFLVMELLLLKSL